ncbi:hypothetical protein ACFPA1_08740 [Neobacillus sp. GCM10023253]
MPKTSFQRNFDSTTFWSGRPDIIIEIYTKETGKLEKLFIGEEKDTKRISYAITGLRELIDYMELVQDKNGVYLKEKNDVLVEGRLFIGEMEVQNPIQDNVKIHSMSNRMADKLNVTLAKKTLDEVYTGKTFIT